MEDIQYKQKSRVDNLIERRRDESDARDIIKEVERLGGFEGEHRFRWIWELLQNARDEAGDGVEIICDLREDKFVFQHNGKPFLSEHLIALTLRSSTKPLDNSGGSAGKFGTGFVTSHLLNKYVKVSGIHQNDEGKRHFEHYLDRRPIDLDGMMVSLAKSIQNIKTIDTLEPVNDVRAFNRFEYNISGSAIEIARGGLNQLELNLAFALLINKDKIKSVQIVTEKKIRKLNIFVTDGIAQDISFVRLVDDNDPNNHVGLLFKRYGKLVVATPAHYMDEIYHLTPIFGQAHLFKELPLIGTEDFIIPNIVQHESFMPTEPRDGVRTKRMGDELEEADMICDTNRSAFMEYTAAFPDFVSQLIAADVRNLHLLAETGYPANPEKIYSVKWLKDDLHDKLREEILKHKIVINCLGLPIDVTEGYFPSCPPENLDKMHELLGSIYPEKTPDKNSYRDWMRILSCQPEGWPTQVMVDIESLVRKIVDMEFLKEKLENPEKINIWLQLLIQFLEEIQYERLGVDFAIYPNQANGLRTQNEIYSEIDLEGQFKLISKGLGRDLSDELLPIGFNAKFVQAFNVKEFLNDMNNTIGTLRVETASESEKQAIINICCTFRGTRAEKREIWYDLLHRLIPAKADKKVIVQLEEDYNWESAEKWALKLVSLMIQDSRDLSTFTQSYFQDENTALVWLNDFLKFVFRNEENRTALEYNIILTQDKVFRKYSDAIYSEKSSSEFLPIIKRMFKEQRNFQDPGSFLVHNGIQNPYIRSEDVSILTRPLDDLFNNREVEDLVKEGLEYHELFMELKDLTEDPLVAKRFPLFVEKQPVLFIKAFGAGSNVGRLMRIKKPIEELEKLASLTLPADVLKKLDEAAKVIGNVDSVVAKVQEMAEKADEVRWRQSVGAAAENAFIEAISGVHPQFSEPENPDNGRDFIIRIGALHYSIEIKSAIENKESVKMSLRQGEEAALHSTHYALCVISRPFGTLTTKEQFVNNAKFVTNIGDEIGSKVVDWRNGLSQIERTDNVSVLFENRNGYVNVKKSIWENGKSFEQFVATLKAYFGIV